MHRTCASKEAPKWGWLVFRECQAVILKTLALTRKNWMIKWKRMRKMKIKRKILACFAFQFQQWKRNNNQTSKILVKFRRLIKVRKGLKTHRMWHLQIKINHLALKNLKLLLLLLMNYRLQSHYKSNNLRVQLLSQLQARKLLQEKVMLLVMVLLIVGGSTIRKDKTSWWCMWSTKTIRKFEILIYINHSTSRELLLNMFDVCSWFIQSIILL